MVKIMPARPVPVARAEEAPPTSIPVNMGQSIPVNILPNQGQPGGQPAAQESPSIPSGMAPPFAQFPPQFFYNPMAGQNFDDATNMGQQMYPFMQGMQGMQPMFYPGGMMPNYGMFGQPMQPGFPAFPMMGQGQMQDMARRGSNSSIGSVEIPVQHFDEQGNKISK